MSTTYNGNIYYEGTQPDFLNTDSFGYYYDADRTKTRTPSSLTAHTGHSPGPSGPLSTPPQSRYPSQPPTEQAPDQMIWDDVANDSSDSPTVRTPDNEAFDLEMQDAPESMRDFYQDPRSAATGHSTQGVVPSMGYVGLIPDQDAMAAYNAAAASLPQYQAPFVPGAHAPQAAMFSQPFNQQYSQQYIGQSTDQSPWNSHGHLRNSAVPRSGVVVFDPEYDLLNPHLFAWRDNSLQPEYQVSPLTQSPPNPSLDNPYFFTAQNYGAIDPSPTDQSPVGMGVTIPSPSPDSQNFVNLDPGSSYFAETFVTGSQGSIPSVRPSLSGHSQSPHQAAVSPYTSIPSPGGSEGIFSYQPSDSEITIDTRPNDQLNIRLKQHPPSPVQVETSPTNTTLDVGFDAERETSLSQRALSVSGQRGRPGGRALGTHLEPKVAKAAHDMRRIVACWHCVLQRDKCGPGDTCERCLKRAQRPNADCGLGCSRIKLVELAPYFLPSLVTQMHEDAHLTHFVSQYIRQWGNVEITVYMTCGQAKMPRIPVKVYEFIPRGSELLTQIQYITDPVTHERKPVRKVSPALGMVHINHNEEKKYDKYISDIVDNHLDAFGELCWMEDDNDFQQKLFRLMTRVKTKSDDEAKLLREVFRLIVCTFIMSHTISIADETKRSSLSRMHSYDPNNLDKFISPRMTNRQLKYFFARLQRSILSTVLNKLQQIFKSSKGCDKWMAAFVAVVGMCMAHEDQEKTIHCVMATKATTENLDPRDMQARADIACREIDSRMSFINQIFRWKYNRKCNPLRDSDQDWEQEAGFGDASSVSFVRQVAQLVKENIDFLQTRQSVSISAHNEAKYTSRLVGQFLLSFWLPS
ncbi:hypothetical protein P154DRAFT_86290 [Amniculicola lignicola CBS 123094]|uniref:Uncharacterized protein n=1 Tax=Amniculicola lignicola CBS 123094 TaxID=1392246 RepID=A0A6A5WNX5_9PLEO|nr:hypothetical protein P154DRAFT_86290 [Amniculicola lignicola CBS 123094]